MTHTPAILHDVPLGLHSTMRLGGRANALTEVDSKEALVAAIQWAESQALPSLMIGGGSNIIWRDEGYPGLVIVNRIPGFAIQPHADQTATVTVGAGEDWDKTVERTVQAGLTGIEALSLIPGTAGGTPVQNVGAYGQEISQTLLSLEAYDHHLGQFCVIPAGECAFGYRTSRFKQKDRGRFYITSLTFRLREGAIKPPLYAALAKYVDDHAITDTSPASIRQAVIAIRNSKLPDPAHVANNGSFFGNPIISSAFFAKLQAIAPDVPHWPTADGRVKIPAAWLLEQAGFKDFHDAETGMGTWPAQPLVLVNESAHSTTQLLAFKHRIVSAVEQRYNITLEQEPELLPA
jgi:UDP-N-acetylmuramate dehydrogenase